MKGSVSNRSARVTFGALVAHIESLNPHFVQTRAPFGFRSFERQRGQVMVLETVPPVEKRPGGETLTASGELANYLWSKPLGAVFHPGITPIRVAPSIARGYLSAAPIPR